MEANPVVPPVSQTTAMPEEHGARILRATDDVDIPQLGQAPLFVRYFYDDCIQGPMSNFDADGDATCRRFIVFGNPGSESYASS